jgi:DNA-binding response OmpR family regulator
MAALLIIEDDPRIRASLAARLAERGHQVETAHLAMHGVEAALSTPFDVVVLDLGLPDIDGADVLRMIRSVSDVAVVVATARDDEAEIIKLLNAGADDYVVKPYSVDHLDARIGAVLRRKSRGVQEERVLRVGKLVVDLDGHEASIDGRRLDLTAKEFELLAFLAERPGRVVSKRELLAGVWRQPYGGADKTVDVHLSWLRRKLGETAAEPRYLHTKRGVGVRLSPPDA